LNTSLPGDQQHPASTIDVDLRIDEAWIRKMIRQEDRTFRLKDYEFHQLSLSLNADMVTVGARVAGKKNSMVGITARPLWNAAHQKFEIRDVLVQTKTTNIILKSMGWLASNFMQDKMDERIEGMAQQFYQRYLEKVTTGPVEIPLRGHGKATGTIRSIRIHSIRFMEKAILVSASIEGTWHIHLQH
jgi:hypothetical protein